MEILEQDLVHRSLCPLYDSQVEAVNTCVLAVFRRALLAMFHKTPMSLPQIREAFGELWDTEWLKTNESIPASGPYWEGPKLGRSAASRIYTLLLQYEVLQPITVYELVIDSYTIKGEYALLKKRAKNAPVCILVPHSRPYFRTEQPEITGLLRFWHARSMFPSYRDMSIIHVPLFRGRTSWQNPSDLPIVLAYIQGIISLYSTGIRYPSVGSHCDSCKSRKCMEAFNVGSHDHPWQRQLAQIRSRRT